MWEKQGVMRHQKEKAEGKMVRSKRNGWGVKRVFSVFLWQGTSIFDQPFVSCISYTSRHLGPALIMAVRLRRRERGQAQYLLNSWEEEKKPRGRCYTWAQGLFSSSPSSFCLLMLAPFCHTRCLSLFFPFLSLSLSMFRKSLYWLGQHWDPVPSFQASVSFFFSFFFSLPWKSALGLETKIPIWWPAGEKETLPRKTADYLCDSITWSWN